MQEQTPKFNLPEQEEKILEFWERDNTFAKSVEKNKKAKPFVFYEGPPTANGRPGIHHAEARSFKDAVCRYKTMRGYFVPRKAGWDTHGLPVEIEVEKELGFKGKQDIEKYGVGKFNQKAKESVWKYKDEWEHATKRLGFWLDLKNPYITYHTTYIETLWWIMSEAWKKKLLYQDFKVVPWCSRCGTGLSTHELGQGYKKTKEISVYVKMRLKEKKNEFLLVWTTTPWTLPANVAIAVNSKIEYTKFQVGDEFIWSAKPPPHPDGTAIHVVERVSGNGLIGKTYEPLFRVPKEYSLGGEPRYEVIAADFVSVEDGTGMVHIAPAFGDEDMVVAKKTFGDSYPILLTVNSDGTIKKGVSGEGKFAKDADTTVIEDLKKKNMLFRTVPFEHDYPYCWRCETPLLYFAKTSWWLRMSSLKDKLISNNRAIHWVPFHFKDGRFGEFLREVRDWAFSRERYWGTPLPVWQCEKCEIREIIASREELARRGGAQKNKYIIMRHGEAKNNVKNIVSYDMQKIFALTARGRKQSEVAAARLRKKKVDMIFASDIARTKETAEIVGKMLDIPVLYDKRLREINVGVFEGKPPSIYHKYFSSPIEKFSKRPPEGETLTELRARVMSFMIEIEKKYSNKTVLIISHESPSWMLWAGALGQTNEESTDSKKTKKSGDDAFLGHAETKEVEFKKLPRDENYEINLHRPYVDDFMFPCKKCGAMLKRVPEVVDVWFDSGSMPFAQAHYPFKKKSDFRYPADFIVEAVDQTRGWFYTLLAVATMLGKKAPYKNVISLGHVLDKNGFKMSKSKGNIIDPWEMTRKYGSDAIRWYFYTINAPGDPKRFDEKDVFDKLRGFLMTFWNCWTLLDTYADGFTIENSKLRNSNVLDQWVLARMLEVERDVTARLDVYDITGATRAIEEFTVSDFSQWYLRRSRVRLQKPEYAAERDVVSAVAASVLLRIAVLMAPFAPFLSEAFYQAFRKKAKTKETSIHLFSWPRPKALNTSGNEYIVGMNGVRHAVAEGLRLRAAAGIKVRQPLKRLHITNKKLQEEFLGLIKDEVNVKEILFGDSYVLDTIITPELKEEGFIREFVRNIQEMRRDAGLTPRDVIRIQISAAAPLENVLFQWTDHILRDTRAKNLKIGGKKEFDVEREAEINGESMWIGVTRD